MPWKFYLDTLGKSFLNQCDKLLLPALIANTDENECRNSTVCSLPNCFKLKKDMIKEKMLLNAVKLTKRLVIQSCCAVSFNYIRNVFSEYKLWKDYFNPYLTIDRPKENEYSDEQLLSSFLGSTILKIQSRYRCFCLKEKEISSPVALESFNDLSEL